MSSPSYPASLDALANPGPTTETDDAGFELDIVVARLQNCIMAIEGKLGIGTGGPPASAAVLRRSATGASQWGTLQTADIGALQVDTPQLAAGSVSQRVVANPTASATTSGGGPGSTLPGSSVSMTTTGGMILFLFSATVHQSVAGQQILLIPVMDGVNQAPSAIPMGPVAGYFIPVTIATVIPAPAAGAHTFLITWYVTGGTATFDAGQLNVVELKK